MIDWDLSMDEGLYYYVKDINIIQDISRLKSMNGKIIWVGSEKLIDKIQYPFMIKALRLPAVEGNFLTS